LYNMFLVFCPGILVAVSAIRIPDINNDVYNALIGGTVDRVIG